MYGTIRGIGAALCITLGVMFGYMLPGANAATLSKEDVQRLAGDAYVVGEVQPDTPAWPLFAAHAAQPEAKPELKAYAFESNDFASVRGYSGKPINIFIIIDLRGRFLDTQLLDHREPIFLRPEGTAKLQAYANQHKGLTLRHSIQLGRPSDTPSHNSQFAYLAGVQTGTISAKAISRTLMTAAANVATAAHLTIPEAQATPIGHSEAPADTTGKDAAKDAMKDSSKDSSKDTAKDATRDGSKVSSKDAKADISTSTVAPNAGSDLHRDATGNLSASVDTSRAVDPSSGRPAATGNKGDSMPTGSGATDAAATDAAELAHAGRQGPTENAATAGAAISTAANADEPDWLAQWRERRSDIVIVLVALVLLTAALLAQQRFSSHPRRLRVLRTLYLLFTLGFIGWIAQGQLTIVNVTAGLESLAVGDDLSFLMNDPISVILWIFTGITLLVWGRGTFCGWLCPFGALQELVSLMANAIGVRQRRIRAAVDAKLKWVKYGLLALIIVSVFIAPGFASWAVEIEPFKTAISLYFVRSWPYVLWAAACIALTVFVYRGYCRYICPLGAALASMSFLRRWAWLPRRAECGKPCQSCRHRCEYQAIEPSGAIQYRECFQCLDCVSIYQDEQRCLPLIREKMRKPAVINIQPVREPA